MISLLLLVPVPSLGVLAGMIVWPDPVGQAIFAAAKLWVLVLPVVWHVAVDRQPFSLSPPRRGGFGVALLSGLFFAIGWLLIFG